MVKKILFFKKLNSKTPRFTALGVALLFMAGCVTACGGAKIDEVMQPSVQRIPLTDGEEPDGAAGGRDALTLTVEAMKEDGKDTALAEGKISTNGLSFDLPDGFEESEATPGMYVTGRYPLDASNICYQETEADPVMQYMTKEDYEEIVSEKLYAQEGESSSDAPKDFKVIEFREMKFDGIPGFRIKSAYTYNELSISQTEYIVNADKTYILTYTMTNEYDRSGWFADSEKSIHVKKQ